MNKSISLENKMDYINEKKKEIEALDQAILSIENKMDELEKISFLNDYLSILESHLSQLETVFTDMDHYQKELKILIDATQQKFSHQDFFTIQDKTFHISYSKGTYTFFAQVGYDDYYAMDSYTLFSYNLENNAFVDMIEIDIRTIWELLGELIGEHYDEELLDNLFINFLILFKHYFYFFTFLIIISRLPPLLSICKFLFAHTLK